MTVANPTNVCLDDVFVDALLLPPAERLVLARQLIESCTSDEPMMLDRQQLEELLKARASAVDEGRMATFAWSETVERVRGMLAKRQP